MKNSLFILCLFPFVLFGQINLFQEDFNSGSVGNAILIDNDNLQVDSSIAYLQGSYHVVIHPDSSGGTDSCLAAASYFENGTQASNYFILPAFKLASFGNFLRFQAKSEDATYYESFEVLYSHSGTNPLDFSDTVLFSDALVSPYWENYEINLDSLSGDSVHIAIHHNGNDGFIFYLDNISLVKEDPTAISEKEITVSLYPNPAQTKFYVEAQGASLSLLDINGKIIRNLSLGWNSTEGLPQGIYFIKAEKSDAVHTQKLVLVR